MDVEVTTYRVRVVSAGPFQHAIEPTEIHDFIMEALTEGRIDLAKANVMLGQCRLPGEASEL